MSSSVEQIKSKIDIVSLISSYIKLDKAGTNFKGRCPFHNEKTPSFFVSVDRNTYYCFGCQAKGDIFTFVQEFEGLDFVGALKVLADRAGVVLERGEKGDKTEKDRLHHTLEQALLFYENKLSENKEALGYIKARGITDETIKNFRIGFAPLEWRMLYEYLLSRGVSEKDMLDTGLIKRKDGLPVSHYDTFRGRIMFPINDSSGRVVGFSGRILVSDEKSPKYLNSPETSLFNKSEILFGLDKAKKDIRLKDYSILVEGQMDLVMMHQAGITNTVASSGTALSAEHLIKLRRLSNRIIMAYDGDNAGFAAANRSAHIALSLGMELKIAQMPLGKDPADLAKEDPEALKSSIAHSKHIIDFYTDVLVSKGLDPRNLNYDLSQEIKRNVLPYVAELPDPINKNHFINSIMRKSYIKEEILWEALKSISLPQTVHIPAKISGPPLKNRIDSIERKIIGIILWQKSLGEPTVDADKVEERARKILKDRLDELVKYFENEKDLLLFETEAYYNGTNNLISDIEELFLGLEEEFLKKEFAETMVRLQKAEQLRDSAEVLKFLEECQRISQRINEIKKIQ